MAKQLEQLHKALKIFNERTEALLLQYQKELRVLENEQQQLQILNGYHQHYLHHPPGENHTSNLNWRMHNYYEFVEKLGEAILTQRQRVAEQEPKTTLIRLEWEQVRCQQEAVLMLIEKCEKNDLKQEDNRLQQLIDEQTLRKFADDSKPLL